MYVEVMRKKIVFIAIIIGIVAGCDWLIGAVTKDAILNVKDVGVNQTNTVQAFFKRKADVLILGPSTANHHYDCRIIEDSLGLTCYNAGRDGQNIIYDAMVLEGFLTRCTPKMVVVDVGPVVLSDEWMPSLAEFNCYKGILAPVDTIIDDILTPIEKVKLHSNVVKYNKTWEWLLNARLSKESSDMNGYRPLYVNHIAKFQSKISNNHFTPYSVCMKYFDSIANTCRTHHIEFIIARSPSMSIDKGDFADSLEMYCKKHLLLFLDWNGDTTYTNHSELFYDVGHLNAKGAEAFTKEFVGKVKDVLNY